MPKRQKQAAKRLASGKLWITMLVLSVIGTGVTMYLTRETTETVLPEHTAAFYINDYSHVFSEETEAFLLRESRALHDATGAQLVVVAVPSTYSESLEAFSLALARKWGIGDAEQDNGVLLIYTTDEAHVRLEIGYGLEGALNDAKCGRILDEYSVDTMHRGAWNRAAIETWIATATAIYAEYGSTMPERLLTVPDIDETAGTRTMADADMPAPITTVDDAPFLMRMVTSFIIFWIFGWPLALIALSRYLFAGKRGVSRGIRGGGGFGGGSIGGGFSGGGGGGFCGGGGSFGGGGASR